MNVSSSSTTLLADPAGASQPAMHEPSANGVVTRANPADYPNWDDLWAAHPNYSSCHSAAWTKMLQSSFGHKPTSFITGSNGTPGSLLSLVEVASWPTGRRGVALPFTDFCEPLYADAASAQKLVQAVIDFGKTRDWKYVEFRGGRNLFDGTAASVSFYGHSLNLVEDVECLFARLEGSVRRAIRRALDAGVTVEVTRSLESVRTFYKLYCQTRKRHGLPPQPFAFFAKIHKHLLSRSEGTVVLARHQGRAIAAAVFLHSSDRALYKYGASDEASQHLRGNNLVMWEGIKWLSHNGAKTLHLGRTSMANEGLRRFKLGWGTQEELIEYFKYDFRRQKFVQDTDETSGWHNRIFQVMPIFLARMTGALLYRYWA